MLYATTLKNYDNNICFGSPCLLLTKYQHKPWYYDQIMNYTML